MKLTIEIEMSTRAFDTKPEDEVWDILIRWANGQRNDSTLTHKEHLFKTHVDSKLKDCDGNLVGVVHIEGCVLCDECNTSCEGAICAFCEGKFCLECAPPGEHQDCLEDNDG